MFAPTASDPFYFKISDILLLHVLSMFLSSQTTVFHFSVLLPPFFIKLSFLHIHAAFFSPP
jgi:hypothetical protein